MRRPRGARPARDRAAEPDAVRRADRGRAAARTHRRRGRGSAEAAAERPSNTTCLTWRAARRSQRRAPVARWSTYFMADDRWIIVGPRQPGSRVRGHQAQRRPDGSRRCWPSGWAPASRRTAPATTSPEGRLAGQSVDPGPAALVHEPVGRSGLGSARVLQAVAGTDRGSARRARRPLRRESASSSAAATTATTAYARSRPSLGTRDYYRVRFGDRPPARAGWTRRTSCSGTSPPTERKELPFALDRCADAVETLITKGLTEAQNLYHTDPPALS